MIEVGLPYISSDLLITTFEVNIIDAVMAIRSPAAEAAMALISSVAVATDRVVPEKVGTAGIAGIAIGLGQDMRSEAAILVY